MDCRRNEGGRKKGKTGENGERGNLSLFKVAATISCNHTFCRSCILESLRANSCCPVCKTHFLRREARPAPQMDSLVEIFRGMETSAGVNLFTTQPSTQAAFPENIPVLDKGKGGKGKTRGDNPPSKKKKAPNQSLDLERGGEKLKAMTRIRMTAWMLTRVLRGVHPKASSWQRREFRFLKILVFSLT
ncbi:hypothetical protein R1flu_018898 [Riccia fluitans]|uniref:RING-type domain-containing protein n=1 Tax=Riccia fluitans TaxID=41844 RepID=A0ABD1ZHH1_9MARC